MKILGTEKAATVLVSTRVQAMTNATNEFSASENVPRTLHNLAAITLPTCNSWEGYQLVPAGAADKHQPQPVCVARGRWRAPIMLTDTREAAIANAWDNELEMVSVH